MKIEGWKEYRIGEIFTIEKTTGGMEDLEKGDVPLISAVMDNNGIVDFVDNYTKLFDKGKITIPCVGAGACMAFYQNNSFYGTGNIHILHPKFEINKFIGLYLCCVIKQNRYKYDGGYGRTCNTSRILETSISLPTTNNQPDWQFMEDFIKKIYNKVIEEIKASAPALLSLSLSL